MKQPNALFKLAAVASSLVLVAGLVTYRAGAFDWLAESGTKPVDTGSSPISESNSAASPSTTTIKIDENTPKINIMSGSKASIRLIETPLSTTRAVKPPTVTQPARTNRGVELTAPGFSEAKPSIPTQPKPPQSNQPPPTIMGSPKYAPVFVSPTLQWAVPGSVLNGPPIPKYGEKYQAGPASSEQPKASPSPSSPAKPDK